MDADNARAAACPPLRLLVADDQPIIRRGLALMLGAEDDIEVVGQAADGQQALELAHALHPDVVVMDLHMPRVGGVAATRLLSAQLPRVAVVVLTTFDDDELVFEAVRAGARAYLLKDAAEAEDIAQENGLLWKIWTESRERNEAGGIYLFADRASAEAYLAMHTQRLKAFGVPHVNGKLFEINDTLSAIDRAPL